MTTAIQPTNQTAIQKSASLSADDIATLVASNIIPAGTPEGTIRMFARYCGESGLSPFKKQVHLIGRKDTRTNTIRYTIQTGIDGYRAIADRTGRYAGNDDYRFDDGKSEYEMIASKRARPTTASATIYKLVGGVRVPFTATAHWAEYFPGEGPGSFMWNKMPFLMLAKCAEALALRKAFPDELSGVYTDEEMAQAAPVIPAEIPKLESPSAPPPAALPQAPDPQHGKPEDSVVTAEAEEVHRTDAPPLRKTGLRNEEMRMPFGKHKGKMFKDIPLADLESTRTWFTTTDDPVKFAELDSKLREYLTDTGLPF